MASQDDSKRIAQTGLPTPGSPPADDFDYTSSTVPSQPKTVGLTTPVSPAFGSFNISEGTSSSDDQLLYPDYSRASRVEKPLFASTDRRTPTPEPSQEPQRNQSASSTASNEYDPRPYLRSIPADITSVVDIYNHNPRGYFNYITAQNENRRRLQQEAKNAKKALPLPVVSSAIPLDPLSTQQMASLNRAPHVKKHQAYSCPSMTGPIIGMPAGSPDGPPLPESHGSFTASTGANASLSPRKRGQDHTSEDKLDLTVNLSPAKRRRGPIKPSNIAVATELKPTANKRRARHESEEMSSPSQQNKGRSHTRAQASKKVDDDCKDSEWAQLEDYCPDVASLDDTNPKRLHVDWRSAEALDLSNDPDQEFLHPQEVQLASTLRFKCDQYLINKRRIFKAKVKCLRENRPFNRTACQQCTAMDVNKASKLWAAFDEVGWFDDHWFQRHV